MSLFFLNPTYAPTERFDMGRFFAYTDNYDPLTSDFALTLSTLSVSGEYTVQGEEGRPDNLSYSIYNDPQYWWILMLYNNLLTPNQVVTGLVVSYPSISDLETLLFSLKADETAAQAATGG